MRSRFLSDAAVGVVGLFVASACGSDDESTFDGSSGGSSGFNTSSSSGLLGNFGQANYGAAKAGIHMLTRIASMELASKGITVNAIAPNAYTRMTKDLPGMSSFTEEEMGPQFMAPVVCYLASDQAANVTGQTFGVNQNQLFIYKMLVSEGVNKRGLDPWKPGPTFTFRNRSAWISWRARRCSLPPANISGSCRLVPSAKARPTLSKRRRTSSMLACWERWDTWRSAAITTSLDPVRAA